MICWVVVCAAGAPVRANDSEIPRAVIPFSGVLDLKAGKVEVVLGSEGSADDRSLVLSIVRPAAGRYDLQADIRHMGTPLGDLAAVLTGRFELVGPDPLRRELLGEVATRYTLLNYKPVRDVYFKFAVRDRRLTIDPLWFGVLSGHGQIGLMGQHDMDITLELLPADLDEFWGMLRARGMKTPPLSGTMTGSLLLQGPWNKPVVSGHVAAYKGQLKDLGYETIDLRFQGTYPVIRLDNARIVSSDGPSFRIGGALDLSDLARFETQARQLKREFIVSDDSGRRTWAFRLNSSDGHATRLKSFVSGEADGRNEGDAVIGLEKHIGF